MRSVKKHSTHRALTKRIIALALILWTAAMALLTWVVAEDMYRQVESSVTSYVSRLQPHGRAHALDADSMKLPGAMERQSFLFFDEAYDAIYIEQLLPIVRPQTPNKGYGDDDWIWGKWDLLYGFEVAEAFYDEEYQVLAHSGNTLSFCYTTDENWVNQYTDTLGFGYIDLDLLEGATATFRKILGADPQGSILSEFFLPVMRLTGHFENNQFHPIKIERGWYQDSDYLDQNTSRLNQADTHGQLDWEVLVETDAVSPADYEVIYAWNVENTYFDTDPITAQDEHFGSLVDLLHASVQRVTVEDPPAIQSRKNLLESIIIRKVYGAEDYYGTYSYGIVVRCWPLTYAVLRMFPAYLVSLGLVALLVWLLLRNIRRRLTEPLERLAYSAASGTTVIPNDFWPEPQTLAKYLLDSRQELADTNSQLQQTKSALHYAQYAEEKRRQLISNITHELKTPLAVIHSYVEGLQSDIPQEKKDHYLEVIQDETQRMDAMVLQMLDLSRLEAGKVHLSMEPFSLYQLTQTVTQRMEPLLATKDLTLSYGNAQDFQITADESRIEQVITNLVTNAIKYTDEGGQICIHITLRQRKAHFAIENTAVPLSATALNKVWDSFYRADPSRTEPGTGLGLTLVKQIVELHRGTCQVQNVRRMVDGVAENRVEFSFTLPV